MQSIFLKKKPNRKILECIRCGACCATGPCQHGIEDEETGACVFLRFNGDTAGCGLVLDGKLKPTDIGVGKGCPLREHPDSKVYQYYLKKVKFIK